MPDKVAMFVAYMDSVGHARATIRTYMSVLSQKDKLADEEDPTAKFWVRKVVNASTPKVKHPSILEKQKKILWAAYLVLAELNASLMRAVFSLVSVAFMFFKNHNGNAPETRILQGASSYVCPSAMLRYYALPGDPGGMELCKQGWPVAPPPTCISWHEQEPTKCLCKLFWALRPNKTTELLNRGIGSRLNWANQFQQPTCDLAEKTQEPIKYLSKLFELSDHKSLLSYSTEDWGVGFTELLNSSSKPVMSGHARPSHPATQL